MPNTNRRNSRTSNTRRNNTTSRYNYGGGNTGTWTTGTGFWGGSTASRRTGTTTGNRNGGNNPAPGYGQVFNCFEQKIDSFRTLASQACGTAPRRRPTPTTLNSFANWINKGAVINRVTPAQICRWTGRTQRFTTATAAKTALTGKFGTSVIKAVTCDKNGNFLVATAPTRNGRNFRFPNH